VAERALAGTQKKAEAEERTIVWVDEAGFYLLPACVRTYAPRGHTPVLRVPLTHDHLSVISALTTSGRVLLHVQEQAFRGPRVVRFLKHLLRQMPGKLLVIWDGAPIHRSKVVKAFLAEGGAERLWLEQLPGYAPELNPVEGIWRQRKRVHLRNVCCRTLVELRYEVRLATANLRHKAKVLASFPKLCGYQL
jgi:transposase